MFAVYVALLAWIVLWKLEIPFVGTGAERQVKLIPFVATAQAGESDPLEVVANVFLFVPFGVYLRLLSPSCRTWVPIAVIAGASIGLEVTQYGLAVGRSDVSDVVANTVGGLVGLGLVRAADQWFHARARTAMTWVCATETVLSVVGAGRFVASPSPYGITETVDRLAAGLFVASPIHYGLRPPDDVMVCATGTHTGLSRPCPGPRPAAAP